jgi:hypothetical protein
MSGAAHAGVGGWRCRLAAVLVAAALLIPCGAHAAARFCIDTSTLQFGNRPVGSTSTQTVGVRNCGDVAWTFTGVATHPATSTAFDVATTCATGATLAPGDACTASVTFAPTVPGQVSGGLWLRNAAATDALLAFYGRGVDASAGTAALSFDPPVAAFGAVTVGSSATPVALDVRNAGPAAMTLTAIVLNGPQAHDFSGDEDSCVVGGAVAAGASCRITLRFTPQATGLRLASLVIDSPQIASLAILDVEGVGVAPGAPALVTLVEYYNAALDHYFLTPLPGEIALCDAGVAPCAGWTRTGAAFAAYANADPAHGAVAACRFFDDAYAPKSAHFYALRGLGCEETLARFPDWRLESDDLFAMAAPSPDGACPAATRPVYRLFNGGIGGAPDHRFTIDPAIRATMIARGWIAEGYGVGVAFCAPS